MSRTRGGLISRMVLATGALLLIVGAAFGVLLFSINEQRTTARVTRHAQQVFDAVGDVERLADDAQTRQVQYFVTGDAGYVADWQVATADLPARPSTWSRSPRRARSGTTQSASPRSRDRSSTTTRCRSWMRPGEAIRTRGTRRRCGKAIGGSPNCTRRPRPSG
ncbi:CHASE3 domain-containing protein [Dactylosporangium darangshiense]|uniref:CHASE3 domain-containing protein n=1 Tax=Dactylosporangium darangshiense TaxID=579108 RepID=UPI00363AC574